MKSKFQIDKPKEIEATMTITMKIKEWEELRKELTNHHPAWQLKEHIDELIRKANESFEKEDVRE